MRNVLLSSISIVVVMFAACGGKPAPKGGGSASSTGSATGPGGSTCCCELPSAPPTFEVQDSRKCHEDSHGVCKDDAPCQGTARTVP